MKQLNSISSFLLATGFLIGLPFRIEATPVDLIFADLDFALQDEIELLAEEWSYYWDMECCQAYADDTHASFNSFSFKFYLRHFNQLVLVKENYQTRNQHIAKPTDFSIRCHLRTMPSSTSEDLSA